MILHHHLLKKPFIPIYCTGGSKKDFSFCQFRNLGQKTILKSLLYKMNIKWKINAWNWVRFEKKSNLQSFKNREPYHDDFDHLTIWNRYKAWYTTHKEEMQNNLLSASLMHPVCLDITNELLICMKKSTKRVLQSKSWKYCTLKIENTVRMHFV